MACCLACRAARYAPYGCRLHGSGTPLGPGVRNLPRSIQRFAVWGRFRFVWLPLSDLANAGPKGCCGSTGPVRLDPDWSAGSGSRRRVCSGRDRPGGILRGVLASPPTLARGGRAWNLTICNTRMIQDGIEWCGGPGLRALPHQARRRPITLGLRLGPSIPSGITSPGLESRRYNCYLLYTSS
jgi:hypothetical protein